MFIMYEEPLLYLSTIKKNGKGRKQKFQLSEADNF